MVIRRLGALSFAKVSGMLYALMGLMFGALFSIVAMVGGAMFPRESAGAGMLFGAGAIVILPIFYGVLGFIFSYIAAALYNLVAGWVGGVEIETL